MLFSGGSFIFRKNFPVCNFPTVRVRTFEARRNGDPMFEELENAFLCFEHWSNTQVIFYDSPLVISQYSRSMHRNSYCQIVKACGHEKQCAAFDWKQLMLNAHKFRNGGIKICRGGLWEWFCPVFQQDDKLIGVLLAGQRIANAEAAGKFPVYQTKDPLWKLSDTPEMHGIPPLDLSSGEDEWVMEGLRQLTARVRDICLRHCTEDLKRENLPRKEFLRLLFERLHRNDDFSVETLAKYFHLSTSRMYHLIKKISGKTFQQLCNELRLKEATDLLEDSGLLIREISDYCNFSSPAYFFRIFKATYGMTPEEYRLRHHDRKALRKKSSIRRF